MKIYTMYLPQFHIVKENSEWWGEGYTDWEAVKCAESYYENHNQPRKPLNYNYYNLLDKTTMSWQADIMKKYGIDGICMYHYWFKDGIRILEKPAENLLKWKDIDMPFCFYWDSASWVRSWSKIAAGNEWNLKFESQVVVSGEKELLLEQDYGNEISWYNHFKYLLPFFKDERYIRINGKPVFMIYRTNEIENADEMFQKWDDWAKKEELDGIYFIGANCAGMMPHCFEAELIHSPANIFGRLKKHYRRDDVNVFSYDELWEKILKAHPSNSKSYESAFVGYDDTPRRGKKGVIVEGQTPEKFGCYMAQFLARNEVIGNEIVFLNAWNEWGESMYLEPDMESGYRYLQAVLDAKNSYTNFIEKYAKQMEIYSSEIVQEMLEQKRDMEKKVFLFKVLDKWLTLKEKGFLLQSYFQKKCIETVGIYGLGILGRHLVGELNEGSIEIKYGIDKNIRDVNYDFPVYSPSDLYPSVDLLILTMYEDAEIIRRNIKENTNYKVATIQEVLEACEEMIKG